MILVKNINKDEFYINPALIETIEKMPDTVITLINGKKYIVADTIEEILNGITEYYKTAGSAAPQILIKSYDFNENENKRLK